MPNVLFSVSLTSESESLVCLTLHARSLLILVMLGNEMVLIKAQSSET